MLLPNSAEFTTTINPAVVFLNGLISSQSKKTMTAALRSLMPLLSAESVTYAQFPWHRLRYQHTAQIRADLLAQTTKKGRLLAPSTINARLAALRGVMRECWLLGLMSQSDYMRAAHIANVPNRGKQAGRFIDSAEFGAMLATCGADRVGIRNRAILIVLYATGIRRGELAGLTVGSIEGGFLSFVGKGRKWRRVPIGAAQNALNEWLAVRPNAKSPLFCSLSNRNHGAALTPSTVYRIVQDASKGQFTPHDLRRSYISNLLATGIDINTISKLAGHSDINTTANYDRRGEDAMRAAMMKAAESVTIPIWGFLHSPSKRFNPDSFPEKVGLNLVSFRIFKNVFRQQHRQLAYDTLGSFEVF